MAGHHYNKAKLHLKWNMAGHHYNEAKMHSKVTSKYKCALIV